jgi:hypothetical protein
MTLKHDDEKEFAPMEAQLQAHIGHKLRTLYQEVLTEAVPDRFTALLDRLEASERNTGYNRHSGQKS